MTPGGASGGQGPVAGVGDGFAVNTDTPGPQAVTPGLTDWNAGTGDEPLFGDVTPGARLRRAVRGSTRPHRRSTAPRGRPHPRRPRWARPHRPLE